MSTQRELSQLWEPGYVPTSLQLRAAFRVAQRLEEKPIRLQRLRQGYPHQPSDGVFDTYVFRQGEEILVCSGLALRSSDEIWLDAPEAIPKEEDSAVSAILFSYLSTVTPPWLGAVTKLGHVEESLLPTDVRDSFDSSSMDPEERDALLLSLGSRFDDSLRRQIGLQGEEQVVRGCKAYLHKHGRGRLAAEVRHLSLRSDSLGYDIRTPDLEGSNLRLEVKTSTRWTDSHVWLFLSRNEARQAQNDDSWRLVVCRRFGHDTIRIVGWCRGREIESLLPLDTEQGHWTEAELELPIELLLPGLPLGATNPNHQMSEPNPRLGGGS